MLFLSVSDLELTFREGGLYIYLTIQTMWSHVMSEHIRCIAWKGRLSNIFQLLLNGWSPLYSCDSCYFVRFRATGGISDNSDAAALFFFLSNSDKSMHTNTLKSSRSAEC